MALQLSKTSKVIAGDELRLAPPSGSEVDTRCIIGGTGGDGQKSRILLATIF